MAYIYKITNQLNGKLYIGKTLKSSVQERWEEHLRDRTRRSEEKRPLYDAMNKYGPEHFLIEEVEKCNPEELNEREIYWIDYYDTYHNGYNATKGGDGKQYLDYDLIISTYKELQNMNEVAIKLKCHKDSVRKVLKDNDIRIKDSTEIARENQGKKCAIFSKDKKLINNFNTLVEGANYLINNNLVPKNSKVKGVSANIGKACNGKRKTAYGYIWQYI